MKPLSCPRCGNDLRGGVECQLCGWSDPVGTANPQSPVGAPPPGSKTPEPTAALPRQMSHPPSSVQSPKADPPPAHRPTPARDVQKRGWFGKFVLIVVGIVLVWFLLRTLGGGDNQDASTPNQDDTRSQSDQTDPLFNDPDGTPSEDLVAVLMGREGEVTVSSVELTADRLFAVAGVDSPEGRGYFVLDTDSGEWGPFDDVFITEPAQCDSLFSTGDAGRALEISSLMDEKFCDPQLVFRLVESEQLNSNGVGPLRVPRELADIDRTQIVPEGQPWECAVASPPYEAYADMVPRVWTQGGQLVAFEFIGGNTTPSGAHVGMSESALVSVLGDSLEDRTADYAGLGADRVLAVRDEDSELGFLLRSGVVDSVVVRLNTFVPGSC